MIEFDRFGEGKQYCVTLSWDDGSYDEKLIPIMDKYGLKGTFHLNSGMDRDAFDVKRVAEVYAGHEISCHGVTHRSLNYIPVTGIIQEIFEDRRALEEAAGYPITGMSYACGFYNDEIIRALRSMGMVYSRTTRATHGFALPEDFMAWHPTCHYRDALEDGKKFVDSMTGWFGYPKLLYVWGHGHELERNDHWGMIEDFCAMVGGRDNVWYATNMEIYTYVTAQHALRISADERIVQNPSATEVWFSRDGLACRVGPGETLRFD